MIKEFFEKNYKKIMIVPIVLLILSLVFMAYKYNTTGELFERDVSLKGGISATVYTEKELDIKGTEGKLSQNLGVEILIRELRDF
ncbi:MAG: hypothetical protein KJ674_01730, partial [Nanoarchaeota archaeon]|nr:hypothetical protein [Nanoarchaeota archaeon]